MYLKPAVENSCWLKTHALIVTPTATGLLISKRRRYIFSETITKVQMNKYCPSLGKPFILNSAHLSTSEEEAHLGISRRSDLSNQATIQACLTTARKAVYKLAGAGLYGFNGLNPGNSIHLIRQYIQEPSIKVDL